MIVVDLNKVEPELVLPALRGVARMRLYEIDPERSIPDAMVDWFADCLAKGDCMYIHQHKK